MVTAIRMREINLQYNPEVAAIFEKKVNDIEKEMKNAGVDPDQFLRSLEI